MGYKHRLFILLLFATYLFTGLGNIVHAQSVHKLSDLLSFSTWNLTYSTKSTKSSASAIGSTWKDSILSLATEVGKEAWEAEDFDTAFLATQIKINALCMEGETGKAIVQAQEMYEKAKLLNHPQGRALSLQAIGDTYMHTGLYALAAETFEAAELELKDSDDAFIKLRLVVQQIHTYLKMNDVKNAMAYLDVAETLISSVSEQEELFNFYIASYRALAYIRMNNKEQVEKYWNEIINLQKKNSHLSELSLDLAIHYFIYIKSYDEALGLYDSLIVAAQKRGSLYEYKNALQSKGALLHATGQLKDASMLYLKVKELNNSLNTERFAEALDSLRSTYIADRMKLENTEAYNDLLIRVVCFSIILLIIIGVLILVIKRNNKELEESRQRLSKANKKAKRAILSKSMFLSNMTHEIRTPLNAIVGFSEVLSSMGDSIDDGTRQVCGESIRQNAELLHKLINDVMELSEEEESNMSFNLDKHDVVILCRNTIETVKKVKRTSAKTLFQTSLENLELYTDSIRLQQVLINLLINATKFTPNGTITLVLEVDSEKNEAVFAVEDTGCGIPLDKQSTIFSRFEKLHEGVQGSGIGLSICQFIVGRLKGKIWIDSTYTAGAKFVFTHPLENNKPEV